MVNGYNYFDLLYMSLNIKELLLILGADVFAIVSLIYFKKTNQFYE